MSYYGIKTAAEGRDVKLAMQELWIGGELLPVGAKLVARHVFESAEKDPLEVIYTFMLPRDAALRQFRIEGEGFSVTSELHPAKDAGEKYEKALAEGKLAGLTQGYRDGITSLMIGNLQPGRRVTVCLEMVAGVEAHDDGFRFRFPLTIAPCYHPEARVSLIAPGEAEMELPAEKFGDVILPPWREDASALHRVGFDLSLPVPGGIRNAQSPSHPLAVDLDSPGGICRVSLATRGDLPNRDLVLDVKLREKRPLAWMSPRREGRSAFAAWIPSSVFGEATRVEARVAFVVDRSGSMDGESMAQALRAMRACLGALAPEDSFAIVAFDNQVESTGKALLRGDRQGRDAAETFIGKIAARGGTELQKGVFAAAEILGEGGGDIFLLTDGEVSETETIINRVRELGLRVHVLGIGSASQDRFLSQLARQTGGESRFLTPRERVDEAAVKLFSSLSGPVADELNIELAGAEGGIGPAPRYTVFAGNPVTVFGEAEAGPAALKLRWNTAGGSRELALADWIGLPEGDETVRLLRGARLISDLEVRTETESQGRTARRAAERLESLGREYGLASRAMSLVAVVNEVQDHSGALAVTRVVPVGMPEDMAFGSYFGGTSAAVLYAAMPMAGLASVSWGSMASLTRRLLGDFQKSAPAVLGESQPDLEECRIIGADDRLMEIASRIEPDGGLPGTDLEERVIATLLALLCFSAEGHNGEDGMYGRHIGRMVKFLNKVPASAGLPASPADMAKHILAHPPIPEDLVDGAGNALDFLAKSPSRESLLRIYEKIGG